MKLRALALAALATVPLAVPPTVVAAEFQGRRIDGRTYHGSAFTNDFGRFPGLEIRFREDRADLLFPGGGHIVVTLDDEHITDPHAITAYDHRRGIRWEIDVVDMTGH